MLVRNCAVGLTCISLFSVHCSSSSDVEGFSTPEGSSGASGTTSGGFGGSADGGPAPQELVCSADLQQVLDKNGTLIKTCPPGEGCGNGACVPACTAAAEAKGSLGCDYQVATPSFYSSIKQPCFAIFIANAWSKAATVKVSRGAQTYDVTKFARTPKAGQPEAAWPLLTAAGIAPGEVAVLFMSSDPTSSNGATSMRCPVPTALPNASAIPGSGVSDAWHVETDVPVSAYDIHPYGAASSFLPSAELLYPTTAWGTNYFAIVPPVGHRGESPLWGQIVATEDGTVVDISPSVALTGGGGAPAAPRSAVTKVSLNKGQFVQYTNDSDFTGSVLNANKPIAFTGGNEYICYNSSSNSGGGCDSAHQQIPPIGALGSEYVAAMWPTRDPGKKPEAAKYRILGVTAGTTLTFDPPVAGAPSTLAPGQSVTFESTRSFTVKSQDGAHPFYIAQMMVGATFAGSFGTTLGDEEFVNVLPPAQFLQRYIFFTDPTYETTLLMVTRVKSAAGFKDVTIPCIGTVSGWQPVDSSGKYEVAAVHLVKARAPVGSCNNGPQSAKSDGSFGITVWGLANYASYAYPAGGNVSTINTVVVPSGPR
jgi:hypothetical protein